MEEQLQEDWLDARLREEAPYIDDVGFTARVVEQLPPAQRRQSRSLRATVFLVLAVVASAIAYVASGGGTFLADAAAFLVAMPLVSVCVIAGACAILVMVAGASAAFLKSRELRS
jgi:hypothetical protein